MDRKRKPPRLPDIPIRLKQVRHIQPLGGAWDGELNEARLKSKIGPRYYDQHYGWLHSAKRWFRPGEEPREVAAIRDARPKFLERFLAKIDFNGPNGCWQWRASNRSGGYGQVRVAAGIFYAHRVAYFLFKGIIPKDLEIDHLCRNRGCVNPAHLDVVSARENTLRSNGPAAKKAMATHCVGGHAFTPQNTYWRPNGLRQCRHCRRMAHYRRRSKKNPVRSGG